MNDKTLIRVAIDGNEANVLQRVGSNAFAFALLVAVEKILRGQPKFSVTILLSQPPLSDLPASREGWHYHVITPKPLWTQCALPLYLFRHKNEFDLFFTPGHYAPRLSPLPVISSVMDLAFLRYPHQFRMKDYLQLREWTRYSVRNAAAVVAISEATKRDIQHFYHLDEHCIAVIYPAALPAPITHASAEAVLEKFQIHEPFFLSVGTLQPRKNFLRLIAAFEALHQNWTTLDMKTQRPQLVIAGKTGWLAEPILQRIATSPVKTMIHQIGFVTETEKTILYQRATATVLVGISEGFGLPALEAMTQNGLVIATKESSLAEAVGTSGMLVDPYSPPAITDAMVTVLRFTAKQRAQMLKRAREQLKKFSWEKSAEQLIDLLERTYVATKRS